MSNTGFRPRRAGINDNNARRMLWRAIAANALGMVVAATGLAAQERDRYREFQLRSDVATVLAITGVQTPEVKFIHQRPAVIQELRWRPRYAVTRSAGAEANATEQIVFTFYNDQLFRVTVEYDSERTKGLTDRDMTEAISAVYGSEVRPTLSRTRPTPALYRGRVRHARRAMGRRERFAHVVPILIVRVPLQVDHDSRTACRACSNSRCASRCAG